jgi:hypothetical protein
MAAYAPLLIAGALMPLSGAAVAVKAALLVLSLLLFRIVSRVAGVFTPDERETLIALSDKRGMGPLVKRLI